MKGSNELQSVVREISINNNERAFRIFFDHYYSSLLRFAVFLTKSDDIAKEIVSDIFIKVWNNRVNLINIEKMDLYLFKAVRNQSNSYFNKNINFEDLENVPTTSIIVYSNPENIVMNRELIDCVEQSISKLPAKCQAIFRLSREDGFKFSEIAEILGVSESTVKNQVTIALSRLKTDLKDYFEN